MKRHGHDAQGIQRYRCNACLCTFTMFTGTIFEGHKLPLSRWIDFLGVVLACEDASIVEILVANGWHESTAVYWLGKVLTVLDGVQERILLTGRVQIDEFYVPRGRSQRKLCIGVGSDEAGQSVYAYEGFGKTNGTRTMAAFGSSIAPGSTLVHDREPSHARLVRVLGLKSESHHGKQMAHLSSAEQPLRDVRQQGKALKRFLAAQPRLDEDNVVGYLNLFSIMKNQPDEVREKVNFVIQYALDNPKTLRFRDFYQKTPR